jgi:hypothetical protein
MSGRTCASSVVVSPGMAGIFLRPTPVRHDGPRQLCATAWSLSKEHLSCPAAWPSRTLPIERTIERTIERARPFDRPPWSRSNGRPFDRPRPTGRDRPIDRRRLDAGRGAVRPRGLHQPGRLAGPWRPTPPLLLRRPPRRRPARPPRRYPGPSRAGRVVAVARVVTGASQIVTSGTQPMRRSQPALKRFTDNASRLHPGEPPACRPHPGARRHPGDGGKASSVHDRSVAVR